MSLTSFSMNVTKRRRMSSGEINQILDEVSDTEDIFDDESSSSESSMMRILKKQTFLPIAEVKMTSHCRVTGLRERERESPLLLLLIPA